MTNSARTTRHNYKGITVIEVLVGVSIMAFILVFSAHAILRFVSTGRDVADKTQALYLAEEELEMVRFIRDERWSYITDLTNGQTYYLDISPGIIATSTSPETIDGFTRSFVIEPVERNGSDDIVSGGTSDPSSRYVTATVSWGSNPTSTVSLTALIADIKQP